MLGRVGKCWKISETSYNLLLTICLGEVERLIMIGGRPDRQTDSPHLSYIPTPSHWLGKFFNIITKASLLYPANLLVVKLSDQQILDQVKIIREWSHSVRFELLRLELQPHNYLSASQTTVRVWRHFWRWADVQSVSRDKVRGRTVYIKIYPQS